MLLPAVKQISRRRETELQSCYPLLLHLMWHNVAMSMSRELSRMFGLFSCLLLLLLRLSSHSCVTERLSNCWWMCVLCCSSLCYTSLGVSSGDRQSAARMSVFHSPYVYALPSFAFESKGEEELQHSIHEGEECERKSLFGSGFLFLLWGLSGISFLSHPLCIISIRSFFSLPHDPHCLTISCNEWWFRWCEEEKKIHSKEYYIKKEAWCMFIYIWKNKLQASCVRVEPFSLLLLVSR